MALLAFLTGATVVPAQIGYQMSSYHGVTATTHQLQINLLSGQGYRPISLAVSGGAANARYSAVWQQGPAPFWVTAHGMSHSQYSTQATTWENQGYRAKLVAASGVGNDAVFAAVWVNDGVAAVHNQNLAATSFDNKIVTERANGRRLVGCAPYNRFGTDYFVTVFEPDASDTAWGAEADDDGTQFGHAFGEYALGHGRPTWFATSDSQRYTHVWRDDRVGNWSVVVGRTSAQFDSDKVTLSGQGLILTCIAASGYGSAARFGGIFQQRLTPHTRSLTLTGLDVPEMDGFDDYADAYMQAHGARNVSIAVARKGRLIYARGYTLAEPGQFVTQPTTPFRIGSISKPLCGTVIHDLISRGQGGFGLNTSLTSYLGISPSNPNATVLRLLRHTSGITPDVHPFDALAYASPPLVVMPVDERYIVDYACSLPFGTPDLWTYANTGNTALGQVVEQATGQAYMTALRDRLFAPVNTTALWQQKARPEDFAPGEAPYHPRALFLQPSTVHYDQRLLVGQYARDYWDSAGGAVCSAVTLARVVSGAYCIGNDSPSLLQAARGAALVRNTFTHASTGDPMPWTDGSWIWRSLGSGRYQYHHDGGAEGFGARCFFTTDGLCVVMLANAEAAPNEVTLLAKADAVTTWPDHDLFPSYGLPAFPRTPSLTSAVVGSVPNVSDTPLVYEGLNLDQVTGVEFDGAWITSQSPNSWHHGWFVRESSTRLRVHPPQGKLPGFYILRAFSASGFSGQQVPYLSRATQYAVKAADTVPTGYPFAVIVSRGPHPDQSWAVLTLSTDLLPTVVPDMVSLDIGNQFQSLLIADARQFTTAAGAVRWDFPTIATLPLVHFQAVLVDLSLPSPWPLPATAVETTVRVP